jgi:hypothetical protein
MPLSRNGWKRRFYQRPLDCNLRNAAVLDEDFFLEGMLRTYLISVGDVNIVALMQGYAIRRGN